MQFDGASLTSPLLPDAALPHPAWYGGAALTVVVVLSSTGMLLLKTAEVHRSVAHLGAGYVFEFLAFFLYPIALHFLPMRTVTVCWSASSNVTAYVGGMLLFHEPHNTRALLGCLLNMAGVVIVATT